MAVALPYQLFMTLLCGYFMSCKGMMFKKPIMALIMFTMFFGGGLIPSYLNMRSLGLYNNLWALIIPTGVSVYNSIIVRSAIDGIPPSLFEAAEIDGANRLQKIRYITLPEIAPIFVLNLVLNVSGILNNDAGTMLLWQTQSNLTRTEVFSTFILKSGINEMLYSYATAAGVFKSIVGMLLIIGANKLSKIIQGEGVVF